jgi:hypothetical protein
MSCFPRLSLAGALLVLAAPATYGAVTVDAAAFSGTAYSQCDLPDTPEGPTNGPYSCEHTALSLTCAAVADTGPVTTYVRACRGDLVSGRTAGSASVVEPGHPAWTCDNGAGTGVFSYRPSLAEAAIEFPVNLVVLGGDVVVSGSYTQAGDSRTVVVRAHFPAVCAYGATGGYAGHISPV